MPAIQRPTRGHFGGLRFVGWNHHPRCRVWLGGARFDAYALNFAAAGELTWRAATGAFRTIAAPAAWWMVPGHRYSYGCTSDATWDHYWVMFAGPRVRRWRTGGLIPHRHPADYPQPIDDAHAFRVGFERLIVRLDRGSRIDNEFAVHELEGLLLTAYRPGPASPQPLTTERHRVIRDLAGQLRESPARKWSVRDMAQRIALSPAQLRRDFQRVMGSSPLRFLIQSRLARSAELLRTTDTPVKAIASEVGFTSEFYFSRCFRNQFGTPPSRIRIEATPFPATMEQAAGSRGPCAR